MSNNTEALIARAKHIVENGGLLARDTSLQLIEALEQSQQMSENWRVSFDNERFRADKLATAFNSEHVQVLVSQRALIAQHVRAETAEKRIAELEAEIKFPGVMRCNICNFSRSHVVVTAEGMRAGESEPEHCPNGCGPLWHDTYRHQYNELHDSYKALEASPLAVRLPESFYPDGDIDCPKVVEVEEVIEAIRAAGGTVEGE